MRTQTHEDSIGMSAVDKLRFFTDHVRRFTIWSDEGYVEPFSNLYFNQGGLGRLNATCGFLDCLHRLAGEDEAARLAESLFDKFQYLDTYGGTKVITDRPDDRGYLQEAPRYRVALGDDGTFGGFSLLWSRLIPEGSNPRHDICLEKVYWTRPAGEPRMVSLKAQYEYSFRGGLMYHGPLSGPNFSCTLEDSPLWSIHT